MYIKFYFDLTGSQDRKEIVEEYLILFYSSDKIKCLFFLKKKQTFSTNSERNWPQSINQRTINSGAFNSIVSSINLALEIWATILTMLGVSETVDKTQENVTNAPWCKCSSGAALKRTQNITISWATNLWAEFKKIGDTCLLVFSPLSSIVSLGSPSEID